MQILYLSHTSFDVITKNEQDPHVVDDMKPAAMQKHGGVNRIPGVVWVSHQASGHQSPSGDKVIELTGAHLQFIQKRQNVRNDQRQVDKRERA